MDHRSKLVSNHGVLGQVEALASELERIKPKIQSSAEAMAEWSRINTLQQWLHQRISTSEPTLTYPPALDQINSSVNQAIASLQSVQDSSSLGLLQQSNQELELALVQAVYLPGQAGKPYPRALSQYLLDYAEAVDSQTKRLEARNQEVLQQLDSLSNNVAEIQKRTNEQVSAWQEKMRTQDVEFSGVEEERSQDFKELKVSWADEFQSSEVSREEEFKKVSMAQASKFEDLLKTQKSELKSMLQQAHDDQAFALEELQNAVITAKELVGLTGTLTRANAYREASRVENRRAWIWSCTAAIALLTLSVLAFKTLWSYSNGAPHPTGFDWSGFSIRLYSLFALSGLAFYAGRQGEIHRNAERQNRRLFSDLASLNPYLADIDPTKREDLLLEVAKRIFGQPETMVEPMKQGALLTPEQLAKVLEILVEASGKALKK